jgi:hypothetical protein
VTGQPVERLDPGTRPRAAARAPPTGDELVVRPLGRAGVASASDEQAADMASIRLSGRVAEADCHQPGASCRLPRLLLGLGGDGVVGGGSQQQAARTLDQVDVVVGARVAG